MQQSSGDESQLKEENDVGEASECSQGSTAPRCSQTACDMSSSVIHERNRFILTNCSGQMKQENYSQSSEAFSASIDEINQSIPEIEVNCCLLDQNFSHVSGGSARDDQYNLQKFLHISSLEPGQDQSYGSAANGSTEMLHEPCHNTSSRTASLSSRNIDIESGNPGNYKIPENDSYPPLPQPSNSGAEGCSSSRSLKFSMAVDISGCENSLIPQPSNIQSRHTLGTSTNLRPEVMEKSCFHGPPDPRICYVNDNQLSYGCGPSQIIHKKDPCKEFMLAEEFTETLCNDGLEYAGVHEQVDHTQYFNEKLNEPIGQFGECTQSYPPDEELPVVKIENMKQDSGSLFYEPPRFPSLDVPFFSYDLAQSSNDLHQEYSPLGIRQFMMSSMNCLTPFRLWDPPSRENSPDSLLKSAGRTFSGTPSILKKRHRVLLSPLSDRRKDKRFNRNSKQNSFSSLARDFSNLDVMFEGTATCSNISQGRDSGASSDDKENMDPAPMQKKVVMRDGSGREENFTLCCSGEKVPTNDDPDQKGRCDADETKSGENLDDIDLENILIFSPDQVRLEADRVMIPSVSANPRAKHTPSINSPVVNRRIHASGSSPKCKLLSNSGHDTMDPQDNNLFGGTSFKRSFDSPSVWKSPRFMNSFLPGPRVETDITIEDIGYFLSPRQRRSYDALGLMEQLSERSASALAEAHEILGTETPKTSLRLKRFKSRNQEHPDISDNKQKISQSHFATDILPERRVLDFSECETPSKQREVGRGSSNAKLLNPSSYLVKGCR